MVLQIMTLTNLDIVFSDADNIFRRDPFGQGVSLGDLIRSNKYDYIYQEELEKRPNRKHIAFGDGGNTGFFFVSGSRKSRNMRTFFSTVLTRVDDIRASNKEHVGAAQPIFWTVFNEFRLPD